ncbi:MAG TPA: hypothetical protein VL547_15560 [Dinghuibacter sp.]|uniref:hypothetical protein n=1 Tax=Dinghuibacter sp. TaxID=2024697 RepID=UPI002D068962|nr:hypothetical protein [Dinghuibacter sp.]HTJ13451.1 hypothetical protein [Dinghuibacter sp.]
MEPKVLSLPKHHGTFIGTDLMLNVGLKESFIRGFVGIFVLVPLFGLIDHRVLWFGSPVIAYLYVSALSHFCVIRYMWRHWVKHEKDPLLKDLPADLYVPGRAA